MNEEPNKDSPATDKTVLDQFAADASFSRFLQGDFDHAAYTSSVINSVAVGVSLQKLLGGINQLEKEINQQVALHHEELLSQVKNLKELETILEVVRTGVESLQSSLEKIATDISEPYLLIKSKTQQLAKVQYACELLRKMIRFLYLSRKLQGHLQGGTRELAKAAQCVTELDQLRKQEDLSGIQVIDNEIRWIVKAEEDVVNTASRMLVQGMESQNQAEIGSALQVFFSLGNLKAKVEMTITGLLEKVLQAIKAFSTFGLTEFTDYKGESSQLWNRLEKMLDSIHVSCLQIFHLQRVLSKIRDPSTHSSLLEQLVKTGEANMVQSFWKHVTVNLREQLEASWRGNTFLSVAFVEEYPRALHYFHEFLKRLQTHYEMKQLQGGLSQEEESAFLFCISSFKNLYLQKSFSRIAEAINKYFYSNQEDVHPILQIMSFELSQVQKSEGDLLISVAKGISKGLKLFGAKSESAIVGDNAAFQVTEPANAQQQKNARIFQSCYQIFAGVKSLWAPFTAASGSGIPEALEGLEAVGGSIVGPLFQKMTKVAEGTIAGMHREDFGSDGGFGGGMECSGYMRNLQGQLQMFHGGILAKFQAGSPWLSPHLSRLVSRLVVSFVRHVSLVRPLSESGKMKLTADMAQLEFALGPLRPLRDLPEAYRILRAIRPFLFRETAAIPDCAEIEVLQPSVVLHHLFSRALQLPSPLMGMTIPQYYDWLDSHSEEEIWKRLTRCLEIYAQQVNARGEKEFHPIYPVILSLGPALINKWKSKRT